MSRDLLSRFQALDRFLSEHQDLWRPKPFTERELAWEQQHPQLATWLRNRSLEQAEAAHNHPEQLAAPAPFPQLAAQAVALAQVDELPAQPLAPVPTRLSVDVPGRKWQQIEAFASRLAFTPAPSHWLDWCAGKGHLGRRLTRPGQHLTCLEYDPALVEAGQALSARHAIDAEHHLQDVMAADCAGQLLPTHTPVALHACGDLHVRLLQLASQAGCAQLAIAPCCYNRTTTEHYQALSRAGQASALQLTKDDLGLPLSETVTAPARVRRQRDQSMARRLGFDLLQRRLRHVDNYLPTPSLPVAWLARPYADYCQELARLRHLPALGEQYWPELEAKGWQRLAEVRNLELLRNLFRRPLEVWLVLDRALYLQERGYDVQLGSFCSTALTPRNLLLIARQKASTTCG
ncbi:methyltransferase [Pseudomonas sp. DTU_2021_1001937_2_SI_NGA_ILE_001]|uniref:methyltransferase n=1 Tax=Pseudomonas sp. DTU_2021_1001937_2_SI_NGA_ILE_001 TaxID=3077589 RepID=UPI0028FC1615|nr:methyltransferase [Pseudomonas sp. DTU_2021_1001937_2_SI_NGA_ILE_001]WNW12404.1 methyltransferase [Pseudomonas sp. DTU_2021_1001937_2_SI_NGA_ILE_001]